MSTDNQDPTRIAKKPSDWTVATLYEYFSALMAESDRRVFDRLHEMDRRYEERYREQKENVTTAFASAEKAVNAALAASKEAVLKAEFASERRFEGVNEFRSALADQQRTLMPRSEFESIVSAQDAKIDALEKRQDRQEGRGAGIKDFIGWIIAAIAVLAFALTWRTGAP